MERNNKVMRSKRRKNCAPYSVEQKPLVERRRRAKMTEQVNLLRVACNMSQPTNRMERAEILENAFQILQLQETPQSDSVFSCGFMDCIVESLQFLHPVLQAEERANLTGLLADKMEQNAAVFDQLNCRMIPVADQKNSCLKPHKITIESSKLLDMWCNPQNLSYGQHFRK